MLNGICEEKSIRILFLSHDSSLYGAQLSLLGLLSRLDRSKFEAMVVAPQAGALNEAIEDLGIPIVVRRTVHWISSGTNAKKSYLQISRDFLSGLKTRVWALSHLIERNQIDVVYTNTVTPIEGALAARLTRRPHIWHLREQVAGNSQLKSLAPAWLIPHIVGQLSERVIVNSRYLAKAYTHDKTRNKLEVIYNGVDPVPFNFDRDDAAKSLRMQLGLEAATRLVVQIGSIIPRKGQMLLVQAAARIAQQIPGATFLIIGEGEADYICQIKDYCKSAGIQERVLFLGWRPDIPQILAAADLLIVAADEEPFGRTVIEAMAAGTPVVSTRCGGPEEIVIDKRTGLLVPPRDVDALALAIAHILGDPAEAARFSVAGRLRLNETFTLDAHTHKVQSVIKDVVHTHQNNLSQ